MSSSGIMEKIYNGVLDESIFHSFKPIPRTERVQLMVEKYRKLLEEYPPSLIEKKGKIPGEMLEKMGEIGLFGVLIPESYGGLGFSLGEYLKIVEEMAKIDLAVALVSLAHLSIGIKAIMIFGHENQKQKYLRPAASGDMIFSYALTEPNIGSDAKHIETRAELSEDGAHYILNGQKTYITNANYARGLTVFAQMDSKRPGFMGAFIVETGWEGIRIFEDMPKMGLKASSTAAIHFKDVRVPKENLVGHPGDGFKIAMTVLNYGRLALGAASVAMMDQSLKDMKKRASTRIQFGVPIESFPLVQEKMVRARVYSFVSSSMNTFTANILDNDPNAGVAIESSHCKLFGTTRAWDTLYDALQIAGGAGYLATQPYEKRMRDFRVTTVFEGTTEIHSIYPPLFVLRRKMKEMASRDGRKSLNLSFYRQHLARRMEWPVRAEDKIMRRALQLAKANARSMRWMLLVGSLFYGRKMGEKELLLRRITTLSLYTYGILSIMARMWAEQRKGDSNDEHRDLLRYFVEEAKEIRKQNKRILDSRKESLMARIVKKLRNNQESNA